MAVYSKFKSFMNPRKIKNISNETTFMTRLLMTKFLNFSISQYTFRLNYHFQSLLLEALHNSLYLAVGVL